MEVSSVPTFKERIFPWLQDLCNGNKKLKKKKEYLSVMTSKEMPLLIKSLSFPPEPLEQLGPSVAGEGQASFGW